mgnify:CR=1 FL=1
MYVFNVWFFITFTEKPCNTLGFSLFPEMLFINTWKSNYMCYLIVYIINSPSFFQFYELFWVIRFVYSSTFPPIGSQTGHLENKETLGAFGEVKKNFGVFLSLLIVNFITLNLTLVCSHIYFYIPEKDYWVTFLFDIKVVFFIHLFFCSYVQCCFRKTWCRITDPILWQR